MNAQEIIEYIRTSEKKTPVKVYIWEKEPVDFPGCQVFPAADGMEVYTNTPKLIENRKKTLKLIRENAELAQQHQIEM